MNLAVSRVKFNDSESALSSARIQLDILARLLYAKDGDYSDKSWGDPEFLTALDDVFFQVSAVSKKIESLYRHVSMEYQLPSSEYFVTEFEK